MNFTHSVENHAEKLVKRIVEAGVKLVVAGGSISEICLHFFNKYGIMALKVMSKFELMRVAKCLGARIIPKLRSPVPEDLGFSTLA